MRFLILAALVGLATAATVSIIRNPDGTISHEYSTKPFIPIDPELPFSPIEPPTYKNPIAPPSIELPSINNPIDVPIYNIPEDPQQNLPVFPEPNEPLEREIFININSKQAIQRVVLTLVAEDDNAMKMTPYHLL